MASSQALLILDMINTFAFEDGQALARESRKIAPAIARIKAGIERSGHACIYVNDNFGHWNSDFSDIVESAAGSRGEGILDTLAPASDDYFILKPKHSGFYQTPLPQLLDRLECQDLVVTGQTAEACVLITALEAHMRDFRVRVPSNAIASKSPPRKSAALTILRYNKIDVRAM